MSTQPFRFLDLPPEIREKIYIQISTSPTPYILLNASNAHTCFPLDLLLVNAQIYHELRPIYLTSNNFSLTLLRHNENWSYFLSPSWQDNRRQIRTLRLNIIRWGTKDFFAQSLIPILEDCVLNGKLRDLEVRMGEKWMKTMNAGDTNATWRALRNLLKDPYLERGMLMAGRAWPDEDYNWERRVSFQREPFGAVGWVFDNDGGAWRKIEEHEESVNWFE
jgi:hypothetical protein